MRLPSGENCGVASGALVFVKRRSAPPLYIFEIGEAGQLLRIGIVYEEVPKRVSFGIPKEAQHMRVLSPGKL